MSWTDRLLPASFRGVPFKHRATEWQLGRRLIRFEFPGSDTPVHQDLGRETDRFSVECYVLGANYDQARDALIGALHERGPGELVHPRFGRLRVIVRSASVAEDDVDLGIARFRVEFERYGAVRASTGDSRASRSDAVDEAAEAVEQASLDEFGADLETDGPGFLAEVLEFEFDSLADAFEAIGLGPAFEGSASFLRRARRLADSVLDQLDDPLGIGREAQQLVRDVRNGFTSREAAFEAYGQLYGWEERPVRGTSAQSAAARGNAAATGSLIRSTSLAQAAIVALEIRWPSLEDATAARDKVLGAIDAALDVAPDGAYAELTRLRARFAAALPGPLGDLPRVEVVVPTETVPALVLAHRLYGDASRAEEIVERNGIAHPGFVPGGEPVEVLARAG